MVFLNDGILTPDLYTKPTYKQQSFLRSLSHPLHTKRAIPFCSSDDTFNLRSNELMQYLNKRGYNLSFLKVNKKYDVFATYNAIQVQPLSLAPIPQTHGVVSLLL